MYHQDHMCFDGLENIVACPAAERDIGRAPTSSLKAVLRWY